MFAAELPAPILFHPFKHHLGYIKAFVRHSAATETADIKVGLQTIGSSQLDLYIGQLSPLQLAQEVLQHLQERQLLSPHAYQRHIAAAHTAHRIVTLSDASAWVLRWGVVAGRYVHLHPGRYASHTLRVKANVLKTAVAAAMAAARTGKAPQTDTATINQVRAEWLGLPPVKDVRLSEGLLYMINLLQNQP